MRLVFLLILLTLSSCGKKNVRNSRELSTSEKKNILAEHFEKLKKSCERFKKQLPPDWFQGSILVPEDPSRPEGRSLKVFYYGKLLPGKTPTVFFNGGPGYSSHGSVNPLKDKEESLIFIDQRGTGCSDYYPLGESAETLQRLSHYGSKGIVADAEAIRKKLFGNKNWVTFGQSYGGFIVHRYLMEAPASVKAAFSHGNVLQDDIYLKLKKRIASHFRVQGSYFKIYPEDEEKIRVLADKLTTQECMRDVKSQQVACGYHLLTGFKDYIGFNDWAVIHEWLDVLVVDGSINWEVMAEFTSKNVFFGSSPVSALNRSYQVIIWMDQNLHPTTYSTCRRIRDDLMLEGFDITKDPLNECASYLQYTHEDGDFLKKVRKLKPNPIPLKSFVEFFPSNPHINLYVYSGEIDQLVPKEIFWDEVNAMNGLPNFFYKNFLTSGHEGFSTEELIWDQVAKETSR